MKEFITISCYQTSQVLSSTSNQLQPEGSHVVVAVVTSVTYKGTAIAITLTWWHSVGRNFALVHGPQWAVDEGFCL